MKCMMRFRPGELAMVKLSRAKEGFEAGLYPAPVSQVISGRMLNVDSEERLLIVAVSAPDPDRMFDDVFVLCRGRIGWMYSDSLERK